MYNPSKEDIYDEQVEQQELESSLDNLPSFYAYLKEVIEWRINDKAFEDVVRFIAGTNKDHKSIMYMSEAEAEEQLRICSQWKGTFTTIRDELKMQHTRVKRKFNYWWSKTLLQVKQDMLSAERSEVVQGKLTAGNVGKFSANDVKTTAFSNDEISTKYEKWQFYLDNIESKANFLDNLADDIKHRSMCLMNLRKKEQ